MDAWLYSSASQQNVPIIDPKRQPSYYPDSKHYTPSKDHLWLGQARPSHSFHTIAHSRASHRPAAILGQGLDLGLSKKNCTSFSSRALSYPGTPFNSSILISENMPYTNSVLGRDIVPRQVVQKPRKWYYLAGRVQFWSWVIAAYILLLQFYTSRWSFGIKQRRGLRSSE